MRDPEAVLTEIRRLSRKFRDGRISWEDANRLGELVSTLDNMATRGLLPAQWHPTAAEHSDSEVA